jgi:hypothetical protein
VLRRVSLPAVGVLEGGLVAWATGLGEDQPRLHEEAVVELPQFALEGPGTCHAAGELVIQGAGLPLGAPRLPGPDVGGQQDGRPVEEDVGATFAAAEQEQAARVQDEDVGRLRDLAGFPDGAPSHLHHLGVVHVLGRAVDLFEFFTEGLGRLRERPEVGDHRQVLTLRGDQPAAGVVALQQ